jgi:nucleotide-binding universal stress UspA family protein
MKRCEMDIVTDRPLLVAVDFSPESTAALLFASNLVAASGAPLVVLHAAQEPGGKPGFYRRESVGEQALPLEMLAERMLADYMCALRIEHPEAAGIERASQRVVPGLPAPRIMEIAEKIDAQLIVLGSNGRSTLGKLLAGSVSDHVVRRSDVPVTVVHSHGGVAQNERSEGTDVPDDALMPPARSDVTGEFGVATG